MRTSKPRRSAQQRRAVTWASRPRVIAIDTPALGDRSYLAHDGSAALVVDPQRDIDRVLALAAARGVVTSTAVLSRQELGM